MKAVHIPADQSLPISVIDVDSDWKQLAAAIGGPCQYIERARCTLTEEHGLVMVVDEEGQMNGQPANFRAWPLYPVPGYPLAGNVLILAEGLTVDGPDFVDIADPNLALETVREVLE